MHNWDHFVIGMHNGLKKNLDTRFHEKNITPVSDYN